MVGGTVSFCPVLPLFSTIILFHFARSQLPRQIILHLKWKSIKQRKSKRNIFIPLFHLVRHESPRSCCHRKICEQVHNTPRHRQQSVGQVVLVCQGLRMLALSCRSFQRPWRQLTKYSCHLIPQIFGRYMITWHLLLRNKMLGFFPSAAISNTLCVCVNWWGSAKIDKNLIGHPESLWFF